METLTEPKRKEWYQWGKEAYKSTASMMRGNIHHPDYDTSEKREAVHDRYSDSYMLTPERAEAIKAKYGYSDQAIKEAQEAFKAGYDASRAWYKREDVKKQAVLDKYMPIFKKAEEVAKNVDVSDIRDGFPCGSAHLYLAYGDRDSELGKALAHFSRGSTYEYKMELPIKLPSYGQCISFDERICGKVAEFLRANGIMAQVHSWID